MEKFTGVRFDSELGEFEAVVNGEVEGWGNTAREAAAVLQSALVWRATVAAKTQAPALVTVPVAAIAQNAPQAAQRVTARPRCAFHSCIRRAFCGRRLQFGRASGRGARSKQRARPDEKQRGMKMYETPIEERKAITPAQREELATLIERSRVLWAQLEELEVAACKITGDERGTNSRTLDVLFGNGFHKRSLRHIFAYIGVTVAPRARAGS